MKKILAILLTIALILSATSLAFADDIEVIWWHNLDSGNQEFVDFLVNTFNESHPGIKIIPQYAGNWSEINEALVLANASDNGELPGVSMCNTKFIASYGNSGLFEDLTPYAEATGFDASDIPQGVYNIGNVNGRQIAMPFLNNTQVIYYNKTVADQYGLVIPQEFNEWDDFFKEVKEKTGMRPLAMQSIDFYYGTIYRNAGVTIVKDGHCDLNTEPALAITTQFQKWVNDGMVAWLSGSDASANMRQSFYDKQTFMVFHNSSALFNYMEKCDFEVGMAWFPGFNGVYNGDMGGGVIGIPSKNSDEVKKAAWQFIEFLESPELSNTWVIEAACLPSHISTLQSDELQAYLTEYPAYKTLFDNFEHITPPFIHEGATQICKTWQNYMNDIMLNNADVVETSNAMVSEIEEIMADYN